MQTFIPSSFFDSGPICTNVFPVLHSIAVQLTLFLNQYSLYTLLSIVLSHFNLQIQLYEIDLAVTWLLNISAPHCSLFLSSLAYQHLISLFNCISPLVI